MVKGELNRAKRGNEGKSILWYSESTVYFLSLILLWAEGRFMVNVLFKARSCLKGYMFIYLPNTYRNQSLYFHCTQKLACEQLFHFEVNLLFADELKIIEKFSYFLSFFFFFIMPIL